MADRFVETERLVLRGWKDADAEPFHDMFQDPRVMEHLGPAEDLEHVRDIVALIQRKLAETGYWFWAMESRADGAFMGFCGIKPGPVDTPIFGKAEIGWRLAHRFWGQGFAREAAQASLDWGWANLPDPDIWAITVHDNSRSWGLMERLGMSRRHDLDFDHPNVPDGSPLKRHLTYSIERPEA